MFSNSRRLFSAFLRSNRGSRNNSITTKTVKSTDSKNQTFKYLAVFFGGVSFFGIQLYDRFGCTDEIIETINVIENSDNNDDICYTNIRKNRFTGKIDTIKPLITKKLKYNFKGYIPASGGGIKKFYTLEIYVSEQNNPYYHNDVDSIAAITNASFRNHNTDINMEYGLQVKDISWQVRNIIRKMHNDLEPRGIIIRKFNINISS